MGSTASIADALVGKPCRDMRCAWREWLHGPGTRAVPGQFAPPSDTGALRFHYALAVAASSFPVFRPCLARRTLVPLRRNSVSEARAKYLSGVAKMTEMQGSLGALREHMWAMAPELERSRTEVEALMALIQREKAETQVREAQQGPGRHRGKGGGSTVGRHGAPKPLCRRWLVRSMSVTSCCC